MRNIIALIIILLCSCTGNRLIGEKIPKFHYEQQKGAILPISAGSYSVVATLVDWPAIEREDRRETIIIISVGVVLIILTILFAFIGNGKKDDTHNDYGAFPPIHNTLDIKKIISKL